MTSCGEKEESQPDYPDAATALADYSLFSETMSKKKSATIASLVDWASQWKESDKRVSMALAKMPADSLRSIRYMAIRDSIAETFDRLVDTKPRTFADYVQVAKNVTAIELDSATRAYALSVHKFYANLDSKPTLGLNAAKTVKAYERLLDRTLSQGFSSKNEVLAFLQEEDVAFRSFLDQLPKLGTLELEKIRDNTTAIMSEIVKLAAEDNPMFTPDEVVVLLTMRTSRRLLQNSIQCVNDIRTGKVAKGDQAMAYQWMLIQPWISFDAFAYSLMSDAQWHTIGILASETNKALGTIGADDFPIPLEEMPALLIKTHLSVL